MFKVQEQLRDLVNKKVTVDQDRLDPPSVTGLLQDLGDHTYAVDDADGKTAGVAFSWYEVSNVNGTLIVLASAENEPDWEDGGGDPQNGNTDTSEI
jgi:hypothetical protein